MLSLFVLNETSTSGFYYSILILIDVVSVLCGVAVIVSKNPIVSVLFLIGLFLAIAGYLMMLGINFIGLSYLLVYVGAVSILFLFILMLINVRISELITDTNNSIPLAIITGISFNLTLYGLLPSNIVADNTVSVYNTFRSLLFRTANSVPKMDYHIYNSSDSGNGILFVTSQI
jgi:NADH-ubiquinone oxidoreductase chain 6